MSSPRTAAPLPLDGGEASAASPAPTRAAALARLAEFVPQAGTTYQARRNHDLPGHPHVSRLSPFIRHRIVTEAEVLAPVLGRFSPRTAEKFVQEVFWRTYWKGWLEMRPSVWTAYRAGVRQGLDRIAAEGGLRRGWEQACTGATGIAPFDHWAHELVTTGYLHNHARMWVASIWCFTLRLPWELGADFFLRHLLDGDPASNTLGWRWVAGLQTPGKVYAATSSNITKFTEGRFGGVHGLAANPAPVDGLPNPPRGALPAFEPWDRAARTGLVLTEDDLSPGWLLAQGLAPAATAVFAGTADRSPLEVSDRVRAFTRGAVADAIARHDALGTPGPVLGIDGTDRPETRAARIVDWARAGGLEQIVAPHPPTGPSADAFAVLRRALAAEGIAVAHQIRPYDAACWPHATHGFFRFKDKIPSLIADLRLAQAG